MVVTGKLISLQNSPLQGTMLTCDEVNALCVLMEKVSANRKVPSGTIALFCCWEGSYPMHLHQSQQCVHMSNFTALQSLSFQGNLIKENAGARACARILRSLPTLSSLGLQRAWTVWDWQCMDVHKCP